MNCPKLVKKILKCEDVSLKTENDILSGLCYSNIPWAGQINRSANDFGIQSLKEVMVGYIYQESAFNPLAVGDNGLSRGLGQFIKDTWEWAVLGAEKNWDYAFIPSFAIFTIARAFKKYQVWLWENWKIDKSQFEWILLCMNWGPGNVKKHLDGKGTLDTLPDKLKINLDLYKKWISKFATDEWTN